MPAYEQPVVPRRPMRRHIETSVRIMTWNPLWKRDLWRSLVNARHISWPKAQPTVAEQLTRVLRGVQFKQRPVRGRSSWSAWYWSMRTVHYGPTASSPRDLVLAPAAEERPCGLVGSEVLVPRRRSSDGLSQAASEDKNRKGRKGRKGSSAGAGAAASGSRERWSTCPPKSVAPLRPLRPLRCSSQGALLNPSELLRRGTRAVARWVEHSPRGSRRDGQTIRGRRAA